MNNLVLLGAQASTDICQNIMPLLSVVKKGVFPLVQIGIPILLIILGTIDLGKAVISSDDKEVKAAQTRLIKRLIYAAIIFFIVTIVSLVLGIVATSSDSDVSGHTDDWRSCWNAVK